MQEPRLRRMRCLKTITIAPWNRSWCRLSFLLCVGIQMVWKNEYCLYNSHSMISNFITNWSESESNPDTNPKTNLTIRKMEDPPPAKSWSIHTRPEITSRYKIHDLIGAGAYSDVYRATRLSDGVTVALKEVHDYHSAFREIEALQMLRGASNVVEMHEYFWREDEDAVLVLEYLRSDLGEVIRDGKRREGGLGVGEVKRWMIEVLRGVDEVHRKGIVHRDLKPGNVLVGEGGVVKLADFGQARILLDQGNVSDYDFSPHADSTPGQTPVAHVEDSLKTAGSKLITHVSAGDASTESLGREEYYRELEMYKSNGPVDDVIIETSINDGNTSCMATCTASDLDDNPSQSYAYEAEDAGGENTLGALTSCVGTLWFRAPELLYGSVDSGLEVELWALGCILAELLTLEPLFPGSSDIDQLGIIFNVLGNLTEAAWPGCSKLPDFRAITFTVVECPTGITSHFPNHSYDEVSLVQRLACYDPAARASAAELLQHKYFSEEPIPVPVSELPVPLPKSSQDEDSSDDWNRYNDMDPDDSDFDDFGRLKVTTTNSGVSIQFP